MNSVKSTTVGLEQAERHSRLAKFCQQRLTPRKPEEDGDLVQKAVDSLELTKLELQFLEQERGKIAHIAADAPSDPDAFVQWFEDLQNNGPGQNDPLHPWLAEEATMEQMRWFIRQEMVGEAGFDDLISLTQLRMPAAPKMEMSKNLGDEMGCGEIDAMHGPMLGGLGRDLDVFKIGEVVWEAQALSNVMVGLAANRCFAYHSVGCLGSVELTAPWRCVHVVNGLKRLGVSPAVARYYQLHALVDIRHSEDWNREVIKNLVAEDSSRARCIAEGALMRLNSGARTFDRYRTHFGLGGPKAHIE